MTITYRHADVRGRKVFYREAPERQQTAVNR
jgi:hypothetical protein